jgi:hypothetical protein
MHNSQEEGQSGVDEAEVEELDLPPASVKQYIPEAILEKNTQVVVRRSPRGSSGGGGSGSVHSVKWEQWFLVKWQGYSVAESSWEPDIAFYEQNFPDLIRQYEQRRVPEKIVGVKLHALPAVGALHYQVRWKGSKWTTMELVTWAQAAPGFSNLVAEFEKRRETHDRNRRLREMEEAKQNEREPVSQRQRARLLATASSSNERDQVPEQQGRQAKRTKWIEEQ